MIAVFHNKQDRLQSGVIQSFCVGLSNIGVKYKTLDIREGYVKSDAIVIFGYKKNNRPGLVRKKIIESHDDIDSTFVLERGYIKREEYHSFGIGHFNGRANFKNTNSQGDRWAKLNVELKPFAYKQDGIVLLCSQVINDASVTINKEFCYQSWLIETFKKIRKKHGDLAKYSVHPIRPFSKGIPVASVMERLPIEEVLPLCEYTIAYNSNSGVDSVIHGVPTVSIDPGSMVYDITSHDILDPTVPTEKERLQWAYNIAYAQWNEEEMKQGLPQTHLGLK